MKRVIYFLSILFATSFVLTSCEKTEVLPIENVVSTIDNVCLNSDTLNQGFDKDGYLIYVKVQLKENYVFTYNNTEYRDCIIEIYNDNLCLVTIIYNKDNVMMYKILSQHKDGVMTAQITSDLIANTMLYWRFEYNILDGTYKTYDYSMNLGYIENTEAYSETMMFVIDLCNTHIAQPIK